MIGIGTILNVAGIVLGGIAGLTIKAPLSVSSQYSLKLILGALTFLFGVRLIWISLSGSYLHMLKQAGIILLAMVLGKVLGKLLRLQKNSNRLGQFARARIASATPQASDRFNRGFEVCGVLFCAAPLGVLGAIHDGLSNYYFPLAVKGVMDGLAAMGFVTLFGWGVIVSAVPVLVFLGTITLLCARFLQPFLEVHSLTGAVNGTGGMLIVAIALLIFEVRKVEVTDYLPSLIVAPALWYWLLV